MQKLEKIYDNGIPIVFATDAIFIPYLYVAIQSLADNCSAENNYDIVILCTNIENYTKNQFKQLERENISIRFCEMSELMNQYKDLWYTHWHYTEAMYYRFFIPQLFVDYDKVVYLDCDIAINCDVAELYNINMEGNGIAAAVGLARQHKDDKHTEYIEKTINIKKEKYFNSGVLVFNIKQNNDINFFEKCINTLKEIKEPLFPDQDVLNIIFQDNVKYINSAYNFSWNLIHYYKNSEEKLAPEFKDDFINACNNPKIIHFAGGNKPWKQPYLSYSDYFWKYARKTPFYEEIIYKNCKSKLNKDSIYNVIYRRRIYLQYLKCKFLKLITIGNKRKHYSFKAQCLKNMIKDYRSILKK